MPRRVGYLRALLGDPAHDGTRQQFFVGAERDQILLVDGVRQAVAARDGHPAAARHLERSAGLQRPVGELAFEVGRGHDPFGGQTMENEILEPHERHPGKTQRAVYCACIAMTVFFA